eukprot:CAMPEP_0185559784 /NCGR_PEP_ID=MMETSP1381-20130426/55368_1 /TAXON_ID=298111 /ORGANISM="Pavlova sp., Strain CCMP459" /LENGTH=61 /DNA_ID=CAMNT_0028173437 /DNA_START=115 /DNA_END=297 /DNA_ORIENTATION=-
MSEIVRTDINPEAAPSPVSPPRRARVCDADYTTTSSWDHCDAPAPSPTPLPGAEPGPGLAQ